MEKLENPGSNSRTFISIIFFKQMNKQKIISLIRASVSLVNNFDASLPLQVQCENHKLLQNIKISQKDLNIFPTLNKHTIGIRNLFQNPNLRLTVYYLEKGTIMKLHDHNEMHVVSKVLTGKIEAKLYKLLNQKQNLYEKTIKIFDPSNVSYIDGNKTYNLHEFKAVESTFFLDIIFPDYHQENDCNFYRQKAVKSQSEVILEKIQCEEIEFEDI